MNRRQYLGGCVAGVSLVAGCTGSSGDGGGTPTETAGGTPTPAIVRASFGEQVQVTEYGSTAPHAVRFAKKIVFSAMSDEITWTPDDGDKFLLVRVEVKVIATGEEELAPMPDQTGYSVEVGESTYEERPKPGETNHIVEPMRGGYAGGYDRKGRVGSGSYGWLAFEVPGSVAVADVTVRYAESVDGRPVEWQPSQADVVTPTPRRTSG